MDDVALAPVLAPGAAIARRRAGVGQPDLHHQPQIFLRFVRGTRPCHRLPIKLASHLPVGAPVLPKAGIPAGSAADWEEEVGGYVRSSSITFTATKTVVNKATSGITR